MEQFAHRCVVSVGVGISAPVQIDGLFAQDIEAYVLTGELGSDMTRLDIFQKRDSVTIEYLKNRRVPSD